MMSIFARSFSSSSLSQYSTFNLSLVALKPICSVLSPSVLSDNQVRNYAARKGTREKARKKKVKVEVQKVGFIPHNQRKLEQQLLNRPVRKYDDSWKRLPVDDVYPAKYYQWKIYPFEEAVQCHRETHHPTIYNIPNAPLNVIIELDMQGEKKTRFIDNFKRVALIPHAFDHGEERNILAFSKDSEIQKIARDAGATLAGGVEIIKEIQNGSVLLTDFQYVVAHPHILPELAALRGVMKRKFPNPKLGTLSPDMKEMIHRFANGISYTAAKDEHEKDFGIIETTIGNLTMEPSKLEDNFGHLIKDVFSMKPKRPGIFIRRCLLVSQPSPEKLKVDHNQYIDNDEECDASEDEEEVEELQRASV